MCGRDSDEYRKGYEEGLHGCHPYPELSQEYANMDPWEKEDYDKGFRAGRRKYWEDDPDLNDDEW